jgi:hypothetical protein
MAEHAAKQTLPALTREDVIHLLGELDDAVLAAILRTGATYAELEAAQIRALGDAADLGKEGHELSPAAAAVYDILMRDPTFLELERER